MTINGRNNMRSSVSWFGAVQSCESFIRAPWQTTRDSDRSSVAGSNPVLPVKRCESDGIFPSGRSSSMRSTRCMGKNTTPSENGSPSFTIATRSSKDANSMPRKLSPSALSERIAPQNFSRGLASVVTTMVPGWNGLPDSALSMKELSPCFPMECN